MRGLSAITFVAALLGLSGAANATPIEYDFTITGGGTIGSIAFTAETGVFRLFGNTTLVQPSGNTNRSPVTGMFTLDGVSGVISSSSTLQTLIGTPSVSSVLLAQNGPTAINSFSPAFADYDLKTSLQQISVAGGPFSIQINGGTSSIQFSSVTSETFSATVLGTPGPIAGAGLVPLLGLAGAYLFGRKRLAA